MLVKTNSPNVPNLRFPEFKEEWEEKRLGDMGIYISDGNYGEMYPKASEFENVGVPFIRANNIKDLKVVWNDMKYISEDLHSILTSGHLETGDILVTTRGDIGMLAYVTEDFANANINAQICLLRTTEQISSKYLLNYLSSRLGRTQFKELQTGSALKQLPKSNLAKIKIKLPILTEQQKIASFLLKIDRWIENIKKQNDEWEKYKKGMMQKIFSQKIRFKDGNGKEFSSWRGIILGDLCNITTGALDANAMVNGGKYRFYTCAKKYYFIDKYEFDTEALLVSGNGANVGYIHYYKGKFNAYQRTYVLDGFKPNIIFIKYFLEKELHQRILIEMKAGNTPYIVMDTLKKMTVSAPSIVEQQKIADFLTSIDKVIESKEQQVIQAEEWKKGLMQNLFV